MMGRAYRRVAQVAAVALALVIVAAVAALLLGSVRAINQGDILLGAAVGLSIIGGLAWFFWDIYRDGKG